MQVLMQTCCAGVLSAQGLAAICEALESAAFLDAAVVLQHSAAAATAVVIGLLLRLRAQASPQTAPPLIGIDIRCQTASPIAVLRFCWSLANLNSEWVVAGSAQSRQQQCMQGQGFMPYSCSGRKS